MGTQTDERVRAAWLGGSFARGDADAASDLDFLIAVADESFDDLTADWSAWIQSITEVAFAEAHVFAPGMYYAANQEFARFDITVERASDVPNTFFPARTLVFDHDDLHDLLPASLPARGPDPTNVERLVKEWFRVTAMPETIIVRDDWLLATEHAHVLRGLIRELFLEVNAPVPVTGVKHWKSKLTNEQQTQLRSLPTSIANLDELRAAHLACSRVFLDSARPLAARLGVDWPTKLEIIAGAHVSRELGIADPYP